MHSGPGPGPGPSKIYLEVTKTVVKKLFSHSGGQSLLVIQVGKPVRWSQRKTL